MPPENEPRKSVYIRMPDVCVSCGAPAAPGNQICNQCIKIANGDYIVLNSPIEKDMTDKGFAAKIRAVRQFFTVRQK